MTTYTWLPDGTALPDGRVGGDGAHEAVSVRFTCPDLPGARITSYWYVVDVVERGWRGDDDPDVSRYDVENMVELLIEDPATGEEIWSDLEYENPSPRWWEAVEDAEEYRDKLARWESESTGSPPLYGWDGRPR